MQWIRPGDADYDGRRALFNAMIDKRPRSIAACSTPAEFERHWSGPALTGWRWPYGHAVTRWPGSRATMTA